MGAFNIKFLQKQLMPFSKGSEYTVYMKIIHLFDGYKGRSTNKEVKHLREIIKKNFLEIDKRLEKLEND